MLQREMPLPERLHRDRRKVCSTTADEDPVASTDDAVRCSSDAEGRWHGPTVMPRGRNDPQWQMRPSSGASEDPRAVDDCAADSGW